MTGEKTLVSSFITPLVNKYDYIDLLLVISLLFTIISTFISSVSPLIGVVLSLLVYGYYRIREYKYNNFSKFGEYKEVVEADAEFMCGECGEVQSKKIGYSVYYLAGYELFRIKNYENNQDDLCNECILEYEEPNIEKKHA